MDGNLIHPSIPMVSVLLALNMANAGPFNFCPNFTMETQFFLKHVHGQRLGPNQARFIPQSHRGLPNPFWEVPMHCSPGDAAVLDARTMHYGGGWVDLGTGTPKYRYAIFLGFHAQHWNYLNRGVKHILFCPIPGLPLDWLIPRHGHQSGMPAAVGLRSSGTSRTGGVTGGAAVWGVRDRPRREAMRQLQEDPALHRPRGG